MNLRRRASCPPTLETVWESTIQLNGSQSYSEASAEAESADLAHGLLYVRSTGWAVLKSLFHPGRLGWQPRHAVLEPSTERHGEPRLLLFKSEDTDSLNEEVRLLSPVQLNCLERTPVQIECDPEGISSMHRFTLSVAGKVRRPPHAHSAPRFSKRTAPVVVRAPSPHPPQPTRLTAPLPTRQVLELAATSEVQRIRWVHALGESVCSTPSPFTATSPQPRARVTQPSAHGADFEDGGRVRLLQRRVADTYNMGKLIVQGADYIIVEGLHRVRGSSHALKLVSKRRSSSRHAQRFSPRKCQALLAQCLEEVYELPHHVCLVWAHGTHDVDAQHDGCLSGMVLDALNVLKELMPERHKGEIMLKGGDTQRLISRILALDCHLQANLFI